MKTVLILYYSGSGSTKTIGEVLQEKLSAFFEVHIQELSLEFDYQPLNEYDLIVFGFPVFGFAPPESFLEFIDKIPTFSKEKKGYLYTTHAFIEENAGRIFIQRLKEKNISINGKLGIRGPASDASLLMPESFSIFFNYEKKITQKLKKTIEEIKTIAESNSSTFYLPNKKWYTFISQFFLPFMEKEYDKYRKNLKLIPEKCINCGYCVNNCIHHAWSIGDKHPVIDNNACELCLKCVHNCPSMAITPFEKMKDHRLNKVFYKKKKEELLQKLSD